MIAEELQVVIRAEVDKAVRDLRSFGAQVDTTGTRLQRFGEKAGRIGSTMSRSLTLPIAAAGAAAVKFAADIERQQTAFGVLLQDVERGNELFQELKEFSAETPLQLEDITKASQTLIAFGSSAEEVQGQLRMIGDVAQGQAEKLDRISLAFGKIRARGKASMEEINILIEAGVPIIAELASNLDIAESEVFDFVSNGKIGFAEIEGALQSMTSEGGQFEGMMETISQTTAGKFSTAIDNLKLAAAELGAEMLPMVNDLLDSVTEATKWFAQLDDGTKKFIITIGVIAAASGPVIGAIGALAQMKAAIIALNTSAMFGPAGIIAAVAGLSAGLYLLGKRMTEVTRETRDFAQINEDLGTSILTRSLEALENESTTITNIWGEQIEVGTKWGAVTRALVNDHGHLNDVLKRTLTTEQEREIMAAVRNENEEELRRILEDLIVARNADAEATEAQTEAEREAAEAAAAAKRQAEIDAEYLNARADIVAILESEKSERDKIIEQIEYLESMPWAADSEYEEDRLEAIRILREQLDALKDDVDDDGMILNLEGFADAWQANYEAVMDANEAVREFNDTTDDFEPLDLTGFSDALALEWDLWEGAKEWNEELHTTPGLAENVSDALRGAHDAAEKLGDIMEESAAEAVEAWRDAAISIGTDIASALDDAFSGGDTNMVDSLVGTLGNLAIPGLGNFLTSIFDATRSFAEWLTGDQGPDPRDYYGTYVQPVIDAEMELAEERIDIIREQLERERELRDENIRLLDREFNQEFDVLRDAWERNLISTEEFQAGMGDLNEGYEAGREEAEEPVEEAEADLQELEDWQDEVAALEKEIAAKQAYLDSLGFLQFGEKARTREEIADLVGELESLLNNRPGSADSSGFDAIRDLWDRMKSAASGADFVTKGPQLLMVGDNASGREHVQVTPDGYGGGATVININGNVFGDNVEEMIAAGLDRAKRRGRIPA